MGTLEASEVTFAISIEPEHIPVRGNFASGDEEADRALEDEILARLDMGDTWAWCNIIVTASWEDADGTVYEGHDTLGACSYANAKEFKADGYFADMKGRALEDLNAQIPEGEESDEDRDAREERESRELTRDDVPGTPPGQL